MKSVPGEVYEVFNWYLRVSVLYGDVLCNEGFCQDEYTQDKLNGLSSDVIAKKDKQYRNAHPHKTMVRHFQAANKKIVARDSDDQLYGQNAAQSTLRNMDGFFSHDPCRYQNQTLLQQSIRIIV
jgi:hypothetical protein